MPAIRVPVGIADVIVAVATSVIEVVADVLLRWVATQNDVDQVIVSMRKSDWVRSNIQSVARGPLSAFEQALLDEWIARAPGPPKRQI